MITGMKAEVAEYLTLAYKGELAIREASPGKVTRWAKETVEILVGRLKDLIGSTEKPVYYTNIVGQVKEKRRKGKIPDIIGKFIASLGGTFDESTYGYTLPDAVSFESGLQGARVLMARAFDFHMFPKLLWNLGAIATGLLSVASLVVVWLRPGDWLNYAICTGLTALFVTCTLKTLRFERFQDVAASIRKRVIKSKSMPE